MAESKLLLAHSTDEETTKIVIFGQSGVGKSAVGNVLLGRKAFQSSAQCQLLTGSCSMSDVNFGRNVWCVVDTPGFIDPNDSSTLKEELEKCFVILSPGFHVALYVISLSTRFTPLNAHALDLFQTWFGEDIYKYLQIVFNKIDLFDGDVKEYISKCEPKLKKFVEKCQFPPIAMCSRDAKNQICTDDRVQLMKAIEQIKQSNSNKHYTLKDFMKIEPRLQKKQNTLICFGGVVCAVVGFLSFGLWGALLVGAGGAFLLKVFMNRKKTLTNM